jgi:uncharacterized UBP type Zn finger protein
VATQKYFHSQVEETFTCAQCGHAMVVKNDLRGFSLPFPTNGRSSCNVQDMLASYFQDEEHSLLCASCGTVSGHNLHKKLLSWPPVLVLHMKREAESGRFSNSFSHRSDKHVDIPTRLDAHECPSAVYRLRSVVARFGSSAECGHYTCHVRNEENTWTEYNDDYVSSHGREPAQSLGRNAHILFYTLDPHAPPLAQECKEVRDIALAPVSKAPQKCGTTNSSLSTYILSPSMFQFHSWLQFQMPQKPTTSATSQECGGDQERESTWGFSEDDMLGWC